MNQQHWVTKVAADHPDGDSRVAVLYDGFGPDTKPSAAENAARRAAITARDTAAVCGATCLIAIWRDDEPVYTLNIREGKTAREMIR